MKSHSWIILISAAYVLFGCQENSDSNSAQMNNGQMLQPDAASSDDGASTTDTSRPPVASDAEPIRDGELDMHSSQVDMDLDATSLSPDGVAPCRPQPEVCDGQDDDCDGRIDEGVPDGDVRERGDVPSGAWWNVDGAGVCPGCFGGWWRSVYLSQCEDQFQAPRQPTSTSGRPFRDRTDPHYSSR